MADIGRPVRRVRHKARTKITAHDRLQLYMQADTRGWTEEQLEEYRKGWQRAWDDAIAEMNERSPKVPIT